MANRKLKKKEKEESKNGDNKKSRKPFNNYNSKNKKIKYKIATFILNSRRENDASKFLHLNLW